jgi:hypothetical protein
LPLCHEVCLVYLMQWIKLMVVQILVRIYATVAWDT